MDNIRDHLEHEQRVRELLAMREMDEKWEVQSVHYIEVETNESGLSILICYMCNQSIINPDEDTKAEFEKSHTSSKIVNVPIRYQIKDPLLELNIRMSQYIGQFRFSIEFFINQCLQDFINAPLMVVLHKGGKIDYSKPVALISSKPIYANSVLRRDEISLSSPVFSYQRVTD